MANVLKGICIAAILCAVTAAVPAGTRAGRADPSGGPGEVPGLRSWRGMRLRVECAEADTLVVNIDCPEYGPRALSLKRIRCKGGPDIRPAPDKERPDHGRRASRASLFRPPDQLAVSWRILSGLARLVAAILGVVFF